MLRSRLRLFFSYIIGRLVAFFAKDTKDETTNETGRHNNALDNEFADRFEYVHVFKGYEVIRL